MKISFLLMISALAFMAGLEAKATGDGHGEDAVVQMFSAADVDEDGVLTGDEYDEAGLDGMGITFEDCDLDGDGLLTAAISIAKLPGSNALAVAEAVRGSLGDLAETFPPGVGFEPGLTCNQQSKAIAHPLGVICKVRDPEQELMPVHGGNPEFGFDAENAATARVEEFVGFGLYASELSDQAFDTLDLAFTEARLDELVELIDDETCRFTGRHTSLRERPKRGHQLVR